MIALCLVAMILCAIGAIVVECSRNIDDKWVKYFVATAFVFAVLFFYSADKNRENRQKSLPESKYKSSSIVYLQPDSTKAIVMKFDKSIQEYQVKYFDKLGKSNILWVKEFEIKK